MRVPRCLFTARMEDGEQVPLPLFGGARGPDVTRNMREMERVFCAALDDLGTNRHIISDNRSTLWLNEFRKWVVDVGSGGLEMGAALFWEVGDGHVVRWFRKWVVGIRSAGDTDWDSDYGR